MMWWLLLASCGGTPEPVEVREVAPAEVPVLRVEEVRGAATVQRAGASLDATAGMEVAQGDEIQTGPDGRAILQTGSGQPIRIGHGTMARIAAADDGLVEVELLRGQVRARVRAGGRDTVRVTNDGRSVTATDGAFAVAVEPGADGARARLAVEVEEGAATIRGVPGADVVNAGERMLTLSDGRATVTKTSPDLLMEVKWPGRTRSPRLPVRGVVEPGAWVRWLGEGAGPAVRADDTGAFEVLVVLEEGPQKVVLEVTDAFGNQRTVTGTIERDTVGPRFKVEPARPLR